MVQIQNNENKSFRSRFEGSIDSVWILQQNPLFYRKRDMLKISDLVSPFCVNVVKSSLAEVHTIVRLELNANYLNEKAKTLKLSIAHLSNHFQQDVKEF